MEEWSAVQAQIADHFAKFVRALVVSGKGSGLEAYASAVPALYRGQPILLTAKHVLDRLEGRRLFLETPDHYRELLLSAVAEDSEADAAAILLPKSVFEWNIAFQDLDIPPEPAVANGELAIFLAMGFPEKETKVDHTTRTLDHKRVDYWSFENVEGYRLLHLSSDKFLTTAFDMKNAVRGGVVQQMKSPKGMSGGAVWRFTGPNTEYPSLGLGELAGILTDDYQTPTKCIVSARISVFHALASQLVNRRDSIRAGE